MKDKVLLVDDDPSVVAALTGVLHSEGYDVIHAFDGEAALVNFHTVHGADIVLLDLNMPVRSGWEALEQINALTPRPPVIIITARPDQQDRAAAAGAAMLMEKPLDIPLLIGTIRRLLAERPAAQ